MRNEGKTRWIGLIFFGILAYAATFLEGLLLRFEPGLFDVPLPVWGFVQQSMHWAITIFAWTLCAILLGACGKAFFRFDAFAMRKRPDWKHLGFGAALLALALIISLILRQGKLQPALIYAELRNSYPSFPVLAFCFRYANLALQAVLFYLAIAFVQEAGDRAYKPSCVPWGGLLLAALLVGANAYAKGISLAFPAAFAALLMGAAYVTMEKNIRYAFPLMLLIFWI